MRSVGLTRATAAADVCQTWKASAKVQFYMSCQFAALVKVGVFFRGVVFGENNIQ